MPANMGCPLHDADPTTKAEADHEAGGGAGGVPGR